MQQETESTKSGTSIYSVSITLLIILGVAAISGLITRVVSHFDIPLFLDSIGTAVVALCLGTLPGVLTGLLSNVAAELFHGLPGHHWPFAIVNMATGLTLGLMARRYDFSKGVVVAAAVLLVTLLNALLGTLVVTLVFTGVTAQAVDYLVTALVLSGQSIFSAAFLARLPINFIDKAIAVLIGVAVMRWYLGKKNAGFA